MTFHDLLGPKFLRSPCCIRPSVPPLPTPLVQRHPFRRRVGITLPGPSSFRTPECRRPGYSHTLALLDLPLTQLKPTQ